MLQLKKSTSWVLVLLAINVFFLSYLYRKILGIGFPLVLMIGVVMLGYGLGGLFADKGVKLVGFLFSGGDIVARGNPSIGLAKKYAIHGDYDKAYEIFLAELDTFPNNRELYITVLMFLFLEMKDYEKATFIYEKSMKSSMSDDDKTKVENFYKTNIN